MSSNSKDVVLLGSDLDTLQTAAEQVEEAMTQVPGVIRIENPFRSSQSKGRIVINSQKAMALGTSESAVAMQIYYLLEGMNATSVDYGDTGYDVVLEYPRASTTISPPCWTTPSPPRLASRWPCGTSPP